MFITVYVDDLLIFRPNTKDIQQVKDMLSARFCMSDLGPVAYYLGMKVTQDRQARRIQLHQQSYLEDGIRKMGLWDAPPQLTPIATYNLQPVGEGYIASPDFKASYQSAVGTLMYTMLGTRPDIAFAVSLVSRFASNPDISHMKAVKRIFSYLRGTLDLNLVFQGELTELRGWCDAD
jgi:hypothetical protein